MKRFYQNFLAFFVLLCLAFGCSLEGSGSPGSNSGDGADLTTPGPEIEDEGTDETEPLAKEPGAAEFLSGKFVSEKEIEFVFSTPVTLVSLSFEPFMEIDSAEGGSTVKVFLEENPGTAIKLSVDLEVEDEWGNTISVQPVLISRNNRVPLLQINELRTEYSKPKSEFIEFKILSDGNLGALQVFAAGNNLSPLVYEFGPVEVKAGEYAVLHLRTLEDENVDEYGDDLNESGGTDSCPTAHDFWIPGSVKLLRKTDAIYVLDQDGKVLDAVMISESPDTSWNKDYMAAAAEFLFKQDAWKSPIGGICCPADAVDSSAIKTAITRSISRDEALENSGTAADWYVTTTGSATPGLPNKP